MAVSLIIIRRGNVVSTLARIIENGWKILELEPSKYNDGWICTYQ